MRKADAADEGLKVRVGAEGIEARAEQNAGVEALLEAFFRPDHGLIVVA
jgi:hypothetical protein